MYNIRKSNRTESLYLVHLKNWSCEEKSAIFRAFFFFIKVWVQWFRLF